MNDFFEALRNNIRSPIIGCILISIFVWNWDHFLTLAFSKNTIEARIVGFENATAWGDFFWPALLGFVVALVQPYLKLFSVWWAKFPNKVIRKIQNSLKVDTEYHEESYRETTRKTTITAGETLKANDVADADETPEENEGGSQNWKSLNRRGLRARAEARYDDAEHLLSEACEIARQQYGTAHKIYADSLNNLALLYSDQGKYEQAERLHQQAMDIRAKALGKDHQDYAASLTNLARLYSDQGEYEQAERLFKEAMDIQAKTPGKDHPDYAVSLNNLAQLHRDQGEYEQAERLFKEALEILETPLRADHPATQTVRINYDALLAKKNKS